MRKIRNRALVFAFEQCTRGVRNVRRFFETNKLVEHRRPSLSVAHAVRHVTCRDVLSRRFDIHMRIVEENIGAECLQEWAFAASAEEQRLVETHAPTAQREDDALVRWRRSRCNQRRADGRRIARRISGLQSMQRGEKSAKRSAGQRLVDALDFVCDGTRRCLVPAKDVRIRRRKSPHRRRRRCAIDRDAVSGAFDGRIVAAAMPAANALATLSGFAERNKSAPNECT